MTLATTTATAFFVRDFRVAWSYRFSFLFQNASLLCSLVSVRFVSDLLNDASPSALADYGGEVPASTSEPCVCFGLAWVRNTAAERK